MTRINGTPPWSQTTYEPSATHWASPRRWFSGTRSVARWSSPTHRVIQGTRRPWCCSRHSPDLIWSVSLKISAGWPGTRSPRSYDEATTTTQYQPTNGRWHGTSLATGCQAKRNDPEYEEIQNWLRSVENSSRASTCSATSPTSIAPPSSASETWTQSPPWPSPERLSRP